MTALMNAVNSQDVARVKELLRQGVGPNETDENGDAPLIIAAYRGYTEIVRALLEAGADLGVLDPNMKATALHAAAYAGRTEAARLLIEYGIDVDKQGPYNGYPALHDAIWKNTVETAKVIVDAGANLNLKSNDGQTPLELARQGGRRQITALIERKMAAGGPGGTE